MMTVEEINEIPLKLGSEDWTFCFYNYLTPLFLDDHGHLLESVKKSFLGFTNLRENNFRKQLHIKSVPFLVGFFFNEKKIRISSPRLGRELFLITELEKYSWSRDSNDEKKFEAFKKHADKLASLKIADFPSEIELLTSNYKLPDLLTEKKYTSDIEAESKKLIKEVLGHLNQYSPSLFERVSDFGLSLTAEYALIRIHLLKFLAILPSLDYDLSGNEVKRILLESVRRLLDDSKTAKVKERKGQAKAIPLYLSFPLSLFYILASLTPALFLARIVRSSVRFLAKRFIAGESIELASESLGKLYKSGRDATLDQLGELVVSEKEADHYLDEVLKLIRGFSSHVPKGSKNKAGVNRAHVSIKVSALSSDFKPYAFDYTYKSVAPRLTKILLEAKKEDVFINIDAEHIHYRDIVFQIYKKVLLETEELKAYSATGIVIQAYLKDAFVHFEEVLSLAKTRGLSMPIRLVKGAYWDAETFESDAHSVEAPQFLNKEETDLHFRQLIIRTFEASPHLLLCLASHNFSDHCFAKVIQKKYFSEIPEFEHQCLHMTYEALSTSLGKMGWAVRNYVPVGSLIVGMAYLVRRIMENSSQVGVLTIMRSHKSAKSLSTPNKIHIDKKEKGNLTREITSSVLLKEFFNTSPVRMYYESERCWIEKSMASFAEKGLAQFYKNSFDLKGENINIMSSSNPDILVGSIIFGTKEDAEKAVETSSNFYNQGTWSETVWQERSSMLLKVAELLTLRRNELASLIVYEAGKTISEALGDVDEAIDFLDFYAREEGAIQKREKGEVLSRGVTVVISPWNFPLAIPCGMVSAPLVAGNTVILKSAEQTPLIAQKMIDIFHEAGVPKKALIHCPGEGEVVGDTLVNSPLTAAIVFTGSRVVGSAIFKKASQRMIKNKLHGNVFPVKVITEMGGKNAIIVTANAELDETVSGILYSSFGHAGQKCSAASRILVDEKVLGRLKERLKEACLDMEVGEAFNFSTTLNPVISIEDKNRLRGQAKDIVKEVENFGGEIVVNRVHEDLPGYAIGPMIVELPKNRALDEKSFAIRELFGPIIHLIPFKNLKEAIKIYNGTEYALTGGIYSQSQDDIDYVVSKIESGNVYVNRTITGARVSVEPFGGFKFSGTGPKAGGRSYVGSFHLFKEGFSKSEELVLDKEEEGSAYKFDLCLNSSSKSFKNRNIDTFLAGLKEIENSLESLFGGIYSKPRDVLSELESWVKLKELSDDIDNRIIPGQLSFNNYSLSEMGIVVFGLNKKPNLSTLLYVLIAVYKGVGVTILTRGKESYSFWETIRSSFGKNGLSKSSFDVFLTNESLMLESLRHPDCRSYIVDASEEKIRYLLHSIHSKNSATDKHMKSILTPLDAPSVRDFDKYFEQISLVRAFAINIMRHGAPMDLEGDHLN